MVPRHPSQVYEATLEGLTLLFLLGALIHGGALKRPGLVMGAFGVGYGLLRCFCELFREPQLAATGSGLTMGMLLSIPLVLVGAGLIAHACTRATQAT
jgi:phosphatidylglycerol:prolipoprotein diacylglycerol transferase